MEEKKPHPNQYKEPHFTCEIHYGPDSDKYIREYKQMKAASLQRAGMGINEANKLVSETHPYDKEVIDEILELILDTVCSTRKTIGIAGEQRPIDIVKSRFMKL